ncbi:hypothetical protein QEV83_04935 [Methylocapsa sp. D3K7]|uniref:hypothetical protein n=1 Tax=Methylocapsa sp. D3K7 TaxID=3041435 RepID=UPI00244EC525|nr:hypothetical protein [Methylocapsa sp. D3K7]WGJ16672.1 hypothetical protein QEV83_04935 [Methylocapsa sp. D3K7]
MTGHASPKSNENLKDRNPKNPTKESLAEKEHEELDDELDRELEDSFPASDPPSMTQPALKPGGPERKKAK